MSQAVAAVRNVWPEADVGVVKAERDETTADVVVASVQTLARPGRLDRLASTDDNMFPAERLDLVVIDEAHHAAADTYRAIVDGLDAGADDGPLLLGVTATPDRGDGEGLDDVFDEIVWNYDIQWGIRSGYLADVRGLRVTIPTLDLSQVKKSRGDYQAGDAGRALTDADAPHHIVAAWKRHAADRRTLVFVPTVATAEAVAAEFIGAGVTASFVSGALDLDERRARLDAYADGRIQVMVNCMVLTEGYDNPRTDCVVMARPTRSRALYTQCVGRGTRRHPDKADLLVLDVVGVTEELSLVTIPSLFGIPEDWPDREGLADGTATATGLVDRYEDHLVAVGQMRAERAEMFRKIRGDGIAWIPVDAGSLYVCYLGPAGTIKFADAGDEGWRAWIEPTENDRPHRQLIGGVGMELAQGVAEDYIRKSTWGNVASTGATWRGKPPSSKQLGFARKLKIEGAEHMSKGELSDEITRVLEEKKAGRAS